MEWSKIKSIILLMLVAANLCLLALVGARAGQGARYEEETGQAVVAVLAGAGIRFLPEALPEPPALPALTVTRDRADEGWVAQALLGAVSQQGESEVRPRYEGAGGSAEFSLNGSFTIRFTGGTQGRQPGQSYQEASEACLAHLGGTWTADGTETQGDRTVLYYVQRWGEAPVFTCRAALIWEGDRLTGLEGVRLAGSEGSAEAPQLLSPATVLTRFLAGLTDGGYVCSQVRSMEAGYLSSGASRTVQLSPVWRLETDSGVFYVDAVTGAVTAAE